MGSARATEETRRTMEAKKVGKIRDLTVLESQGEYRRLKVNVVKQAYGHDLR